MAVQATSPLRERAIQAYSDRIDRDRQEKAKAYARWQRYVEDKLREMLALDEDTSIAFDQAVDFTSMPSINYKKLRGVFVVEDLRFLVVTAKHGALLWDANTTIHLLPTQCPEDEPTESFNPIEHYSRPIDSIEDLGSLLNIFEAHYL